ncbi:DJ-1/PfpI family protein [Endozoicomonas numazuensis]|uniref:Glutamine amidotransferase n=1 Tax=Endozoicomonas numazuensis TaxID=1137799 RepID=A0A081NF90_9GAMM|nr:DJ-1/PfpI family protein [Endozoicomonas numazuensis]KEQ17113.1 glutamine amidotransferase [Endozoicomonas numazuensis]
MNIAIYLYDNAEILDFSGPFEVFSTASRICEGGAPFNVFLVGETGETVSARAGFSVNPDYGFYNHPPIDLLMVVGGVHHAELKKPQMLEWIRTSSASAKMTVSVCTGAFILAAAGILTDQKVTTHWEDIPELKQQFPELNVVSDQRWVQEGSVVTSAGITAGIDMSLSLVSLLHSQALAEKTARQMDFVWNP